MCQLIQAGVAIIANVNDLFEYATGKVLNCGEDSNKMGGNIIRGRKSGKYSRSESSPPSCKIAHL